MKQERNWQARRKRAENIRKFFGEVACRQLIKIASKELKKPHFLLAEL